MAFSDRQETQVTNITKRSLERWYSEHYFEFVVCVWKWRKVMHYILQYYSDKGNTAHTCRKTCTAYVEATLSKYPAWKWFPVFHSGICYAKYVPGSGRPITEKVDENIEKVQPNKHISIVYIGVHTLLKRSEIEPFLKHVITDKEKWITEKGRCNLKYNKFSQSKLWHWKRWFCIFGETGR